jgi:nitroreductase
LTVNRVNTIVPITNMFVILNNIVNLLVAYYQNVFSRCVPYWEQLMCLMMTRRSIMPFKLNNKEINDDKIVKLIECANYAPSHKLTYPWRFVVIGKKSHHELHDVTERIFKAHYANDPCLPKKLKDLDDDIVNRWNNVSHYIGICIKKSHKVPDWEDICAVSCAVQNMLLMAPCLGIAGYWSSWHSETIKNEMMLEYLGMDVENGDKCLGFLVLGCTDNNILYTRNTHPLENIMKWK